MINETRRNREQKEIERSYSVGDMLRPTEPFPVVGREALSRLSVFRQQRSGEFNSKRFEILEDGSAESMTVDGYEVDSSQLIEVFALRKGMPRKLLVPVKPDTDDANPMTPERLMRISRSIFEHDHGVDEVYDPEDVGIDFEELSRRFVARNGRRVIVAIDPDRFWEIEDKLELETHVRSKEAAKPVLGVANIIRCRLAEIGGEKEPM